MREFYFEAVCQIKKRFPIGDPVIEMLEVLDPDTNRAKFPSLVLLAVRFPNIVPETKLQTPEDEWCKLSVEPLPFDHEDMEPQEFWGTLSTVKNGAGSVQFPTLCSSMHCLLSLPHTNVDVERVFSSVNLIKNKVQKQIAHKHCLSPS